MNYSVIATVRFEKEMKRLTKKFPSLKAEYATLIEDLEKNPEKGTPLGNNCFKIRLAIASKSRGKSGGARVITNFYVENDTVYLLSIYDKNEKENITDKELKKILSKIDFSAVTP
jgi:mRNA-degrading endonuclease RelE of RelBE toxin-antitoxin system